jgi:hypothetical protein
VCRALGKRIGLVKEAGNLFTIANFDTACILQRFGSYRRITRWEHESVLEGVQRRLDKTPDAMKIRRRTVEHVFGTFKHWMGYTHFLTRRLPNVGTEMSLNVLAYNLTRVLRILGFKKTMKAMRLVGA